MTTTQPSLGILSVGVHLPENRRTNDWWPVSTVDTWRQKLESLLPRAEACVEGQVTEGVQRALAAMGQLRHDPFQGAIERRVVSDGVPASDLEAAAVKEALSRAQLRPADVDLLLSHSMIPDYSAVNQACIIHHK